MTCHTAMSIDIDLWHQRLGHINHTDLDNLAKNEIILGLPKRLKAPNTICGPCQIGKQVRSPHKKVDALTTTRPLDYTWISWVLQNLKVLAERNIYF